MKNVVALIVILKLSAVTVGFAQHWPHWRGPTHDGVSAEKNLPDTWSAVCAASGDDAGDVVAELIVRWSVLEWRSRPAAWPGREQRGQRPPAPTSKAGPSCPTVCDNIQTKGIAWKLPLPAYSGSTPIIWGDTIFLNVATATNTGVARAVGDRSQQAGGELEAAARRRQPHGAQAEHVVAVAGHRRQARLGDDRPRRPQGVRLRRQGNLVARTSRPTTAGSA